MKIKDIISVIEQLAPLSYQESYDNSGLLVGNSNDPVSKVLVCLDCIEATIEEAKSVGAELIITHHPIIFSGLKKINGKNYIERTIIKAIQNNIAIYAAHTNVDNVDEGVNKKIGEKLGLKNLEILAPKSNELVKFVVFVPIAHAEPVKSAMFKAGAGEIGNYSECSFNQQGEGTFKANEKANPFVGEKNLRHSEPELKIESIVPKTLIADVIHNVIAVHPYEEVAYDVYPLNNEFKKVGSGMIGELPQEMDEMSFLNFLKEEFKANGIRYTKPLNKPVKKVAFCGGSGSFLLQNAIAKKADVFITGDFKYHQFFDAEGKILIADIGHYESEQFTPEIFKTIITKKFPNFAVHLSEINTNPINYL